MFKRVSGSKSWVKTSKIRINLFKNMFLGNDEKNVAKFWEDMAEVPRYKEHVKPKANHRSRCIPIAIHGDGVTVTGAGRSWSKSVDAFSFKLLLCQDPLELANIFKFVVFAAIFAKLRMLETR